MTRRSPPSPTLLLATFYLLVKSQRVATEPVLTVWHRLAALRWPDRPFEAQPVQRSLLLACRIARRLGLLETCLVRSLVTARLLMGHPDVRLNIGMDTGASQTPQGHAWVEVEGANISDPPGVQVSGTMRVTHRIDLSDGTIDGP
jgi:hypothetical protein